MKISNYESTAHRDARLRKCLRIWCRIMGVSHEQAGRLIYSLHDHKGQLNVLWIDQPTQRQKLAFDEAWGECAEHVVHHSTDLANEPYAEV